MNELNQQIIKLIAKNITAEEICKETGLSNKQLFYRLSLLKNKGYDVLRKYYYTGDISYKLVKDINKNDKSINIFTKSTDQSFCAILISDLHIGSEYERLDVLNKIYDYCIKEGIHIIINAGDIIDGIDTNYKRKHSTFEEQINYALKVYPFDKSILNFICLGNHDYKPLSYSGVNLETIFINKRHDLVSIGYGVGKINIQNDEIIVKHPLCIFKTPTEVVSNKIIINGHTHKTRFNYSPGSNNLNIYLPSLSDIKISDDIICPSAYKMTLTLDGGIFNIGYFEQLLISDKIYKIGEFEYGLYNHKTKSKDNINFIEDKVKVKTKSK